MEKSEGIAFPPVPVAPGRIRQTARKSPLPVRAAGEMPCEMCGSPVLAYQCKRVCLRCGFMTGCSEGI